MSNFPFVPDKILQSNLDLAFGHVVDLLTISESETYPNNSPLVSSFRKTIIIHTASIIEALLLWKLKTEFKIKNIKLDDDWFYTDLRILHQVNEDFEIIAGNRRRKARDINKLDFLRITDFCVKEGIINTKKLRDDIDAVRELRNRLHIGGLVEIEKEYGKQDLEFCFTVAKKVKDIVSR